MSRAARITVAVVCLMLLALIGLVLLARAAPLVSAEEIDGVRRAEDEAVQSAASARCERPVLRSELLEGSGEAELVALLEPERGSAIDRCYERIDAESAALTAWLAAGGHGRSIRMPTPLPDGEALDQRYRVPEAWPTHDAYTASSRDPGLDALRDACREVAATAEREARRVEACSPYRPGQRAIPETFRVAALIRALVIAVRAAAIEGDVPRALSIALDGVSVGLDLSRGEGDLLPSMLGYGITHAMVRAAQLALSLDVAVDPAALRPLAAAVTRLLDALPPAGAVLRGGHAGLRHLALGSEARPAEAIATVGAAFLDLGEDEGGLWLALMALERGSSALERACPEDASASVCLAGVTGATETLHAYGEVPTETLRFWLLGRRAARDTLIDRAAYEIVQREPVYLRQYLVSHAALLALRFAIERRARIAEGAACADAASWASTLASEAQHPAIGALVLLDRPEDGALDVSAPEWMALPIERDPAPFHLPLLLSYCPLLP